MLEALITAVIALGWLLLVVAVWLNRPTGTERLEAAWSGSPEGLAILRRALDSRSG